MGQLRIELKHPMHAGRDNRALKQRLKEYQIIIHPACYASKHSQFIMSLLNLGRKFLGGEKFVTKNFLRFFWRGIKTFLNTFNNFNFLLHLRGETF